MGAETDLSPPPPEPTASPEPEILRNGDRDWKADMMSALGESVSFGRFLSEPLEWGKWSAFQHNRYLEEAAAQSRPGSVAQKKAALEEHYARKRKSVADADADAGEDGVACWSAGSSCMTDEPAGVIDFGVTVDAASPIDASQEEEELQAVTNGGVGSSCSLDSADERSHKQDDVQVAQGTKGLQLAAVDSVEKQPLQESHIVNQAVTDSAKKRRLPIASLFQKPPMEFSSPPSSGKKTPSSSVKRRSTLRPAKENSSPSPTIGCNRQQEGASVAHKRSTFATLHMSMNFRRCEKGDPASRSRNLGSTIASRISQLESASRPVAVEDTRPKVNQFRQTRKGIFKGMPEIASRASQQQHEQRSSHVSVTRVKEKLFGSTSSPVHPKTNIAKENMCAQAIPNLANRDHQLNDASNPHATSRGAPKDKKMCCFPLRRLC